MTDDSNAEGPTTRARLEKRAQRDEFLGMLRDRADLLVFNVRMLLHGNLATDTDSEKQWMHVLRWIKPAKKERNYRAWLVTTLGTMYGVDAGVTTTAFRELPRERQQELNELIEREIAETRLIYADEILYCDAPEDVRRRFFDQQKLKRPPAEPSTSLDWQI